MRVIGKGVFQLDQKALTFLPGLIDKILLLNDIQHCQSNCATHGM